MDYDSAQDQSTAGKLGADVAIDQEDVEGAFPHLRLSYRLPSSLYHHLFFPFYPLHASHGTSCAFSRSHISFLHLTPMQYVHKLLLSLSGK